MKTLFAILFSGVSFANPIQVGLLSTQSVCFDVNACYLQPVITNSTNVVFGSTTLQTRLTASYTISGQQLTDAYNLPSVNNGIPANSAFVVPLYIPVSADSWVLTLTTSLRPPLGGPVYFGVTSFFTGGQWYVANNTAISGSATNGAGVLQVADAVPGWTPPGGLGGILPGPPGGQAAALVSDVPEPGALAMLLIGAGMVAMRKRG